jgi:hypothetical protein
MRISLASEEIPSLCHGLKRKLVPETVIEPDYPRADHFFWSGLAL